MGTTGSSLPAKEDNAGFRLRSSSSVDGLIGGFEDKVPGTNSTEERKLIAFPYVFDHASVASEQDLEELIN